MLVRLEERAKQFVIENSGNITVCYLKLQTAVSHCLSLLCYVKKITYNSSACVLVAGVMHASHPAGQGQGVGCSK
jgi:hypothetical protein